jgi:signal transduction histidine kinase
VNDLLSFAAYQDPQRETFLVCDLVNEVCDSLEPQLDAQAIEVDRDVPPHTLLHADREMMQQAILNLVLNAVDAMPKGGHLVITSYEGPFGFELEIADSGPGLSEVEKKQLFEPSYSTKSTGSGLGLSVVSRIAESHGGTVSAINCPEGGAAFTIRIPSKTRGAAAA